MAEAKELYREAKKLFDAKDYQGACAKYQEAVATNPKFVVAYHGLVQCYTEFGQHEEAIATAQKVVEIEPDNFAYIGLSRAYQRAGKIPEAEHAMMMGQQAQFRGR